MTKKHFEALAAALKGTKPIETARPTESVEDWAAMAQWCADVRAVAEDLLAKADLGESVDAIDARWFYAACGYEGDR